MQLIFIFLAAAIVNNFVLTQFLGLCPFIGVSKKLSSSVGMGLAVMFVITLSSAASHVAYHNLLVRFEIQYLHLITFILTIASLVQFLEIVLKKTLPALYSSLGVFLPLMTTNCMIVGVAIINMSRSYTFVESMVNALGGGAGFLIAIVVFSGIRERMDRSSDVPKVFRGFPIALIAAGLMSLIFVGFSGLIRL